MVGYLRTVYKSKLFPYLVLTGILLCGFYIRWHGVDRRVFFGPEQGEYFQYILDHPQDQFPPGPSVSQPAWLSQAAWSNYPIFYRQVYGFLLKHLVLFWHANPERLVSIWVIVDTISIAAIFWAMSVFGIWSALSAALLYSTNYWPIFFSRWVYGLAMMSLLTILSVGVFIRITSGRKQYWPILIVTLAMLPLFHPVGIAWALIIIFSFIVWEGAIRRQSKGAIAGGILLVLFFILAFPAWKAFVIEGRFFDHISSLIGACISLPVEIISFFRIMILGPYSIPFSFSPLVGIAGVLGICIMYGLYVSNKSHGAIQTVSGIQLSAWSFIIACTLLILARWYYGFSVLTWWRSPSYLIIIVLTIVGFTGIASVLVRLKGVVVGGVLTIAYVALVIYSASMSEQYILKNGIGDLTLGEKRDIISVIRRDFGINDVAICVPDSKPNAADWEYLWNNTPYPRDRHARFSSQCSTRDCVHAVCYMIVAPEQYARSSALIFINQEAAVLRQ